MFCLVMASEFCLPLAKASLVLWMMAITAGRLMAYIK